MSVVPNKIAQRIQFYEDHIPPFTTNATAIGVSSAEVTDLQTKTAAARSAFDTRQAQQQAAEAATLALKDAVDAMSLAGAVLIKKVRAKAESVGGNSVYTLAELPAPAIPSPVGAPGTPYQLKVALKPSGAVELTWKADNPAGCTGVIWQLYRRVTQTAEWTYIGGTGQRKYADQTVPAGVPSVMYQIRGTRSTAVGDGAEFTVNFGTTSSGTMTASVVETTPTPPAKIAA